MSQFTGPIGHPASTGLLERAIQEMLAPISKKCIQRRTPSSWSLFIRDNVLEMNTKSTRIHESQKKNEHVGTDAVPDSEQLKELKEKGKSTHLIEAEKVAKGEKAPKAIRELACKELRQDAHLRSAKNGSSLVSTTPF